ncbi:MAG TPA: hypothetical protein VHO01_01560 [Jatrophihabitans sp.]|nr:hypothetical protein [Jatrophihabitans sp.]
MRLPSNKDIKDLLEGMLGRDVSLEPAATTLSSTDTIGSLIATYCDDDSRTRAVLGWSIDAGAHVGAAIGLVPAPLAKEMAAEQFLRLDIADNLAEVSNVMAALFDKPGNPHVRMQDRYCPAASAPAELSSFLYTNADRLDLDITVKGYGSGKLALVTWV